MNLQSLQRINNVGQALIVENANGINKVSEALWKLRNV